MNGDQNNSFADQKQQGGLDTLFLLEHRLLYVADFSTIVMLHWIQHHFWVSLVVLIHTLCLLDERANDICYDSCEGTSFSTSSLVLPLLVLRYMRGPAAAQDDEVCKQQLVLTTHKHSNAFCLLYRKFPHLH